MTTFFISYDLVGGLNRTSDYQNIENLLNQSGAERVLINLWTYEGASTDDVFNIRDTLINFLRPPDRLLVVEATSWAWYIGKAL